jgi:hypothetical protein
MVNKIAVLLVGGIIVVGVVVIGGVAAFVLGGTDGGSGTPTARDATPLPSPGATVTGTAAPTATATVTATGTATATATVTPTATATPTATPRPTVSPSEFDEEAIATHIERLINRRRQAAGLEPLSRNGTTVGTVVEMARAHSEAMADEGDPTHEIAGNTSTDRYRAYELYNVCSWQKPGEEGFARPDANGVTDSPNGFETVASTIAGREYEFQRDGETITRFNADEQDVAEAIVNQWWNNTGVDSTDRLYYRDRLTLPNAGRIGVGVEVTQFGEVYATANLC